VLVSIVLGSPLAYYTMNQWLDTFAYRIEISWRIFVVAGLTALGIAVLTVSHRAVKAAAGQSGRGTPVGVGGQAAACSLHFILT